MVADREKVFDAIRNCVTEPKCKDCPWEDCEMFGCKRTTVPVTLLLEALNVLKADNERIAVLETMLDFSTAIVSDAVKRKKAEKEMDNE